MRLKEWINEYVTHLGGLFTEREDKRHRLSGKYTSLFCSGASPLGSNNLSVRTAQEALVDRREITYPSSVFPSRKSRGQL